MRVNMRRKGMRDRHPHAPQHPCLGGAHARVVGLEELHEEVIIDLGPKVAGEYRVVCESKTMRAFDEGIRA